MTDEPTPPEDAARALLREAIEEELAQLPERDRVAHSDFDAGAAAAYHFVLSRLDATRASAGPLDAVWTELEATGIHPSLHPHWGEAPDSEPLPLLGYRATAWHDDRFRDAYGSTPVEALRKLLAAARFPVAAEEDRPW